MYKKLISTIEQRKAVELKVAQKKQEFENSIAVQTAQLEDLKNLERVYREEAVLQMDKDGKNKVVEDNKVIVKMVKETNRIEDALLLSTQLMDNDTLKGAGVDMKKVSQSFESAIAITDKIFITKVIKDFEALEGKLPEGVEKKQTIFVTINNVK